MPPVKTEERCGGVCDFRYARDTADPGIKELAQASRAMVLPLVIATPRLLQLLDDSSVTTALPGIWDEPAVTPAHLPWTVYRSGGHLDTDADHGGQALAQPRAFLRGRRGVDRLLHVRDPDVLAGDPG
jgi:hypothetical protein